MSDLTTETIIDVEELLVHILKDLSLWEVGLFKEYYFQNWIKGAARVCATVSYLTQNFDWINSSAFRNAEFELPQPETEAEPENMVYIRFLRNQIKQVAARVSTWKHNQHLTKWAEEVEVSQIFFAIMYLKEQLGDQLKPENNVSIIA